VLQRDGVLLVKEWGLAPKEVARDVQAFQVLLDRLGVLRQDGSLWAQQGGIIGALTHLADGVRLLAARHGLMPPKVGSVRG
jgi:hypothetical protein